MCAPDRGERRRRTRDGRRFGGIGGSRLQDGFTSAIRLTIPKTTTWRHARMDLPRRVGLCFLSPSRTPDAHAKRVEKLSEWTYFAA